MSQRKAYATRLSTFEAEALEIAKEVWPEHADKDSELIRSIINTWRRDREENGGKTRKIIEVISEAKAEIIREIHELGHKLNVEVTP
jgi:DNA-binding response OmpR family regulator